jgi:Domain of unknown function (DUF6457)
VNGWLEQAAQRIAAAAELPLQDCVLADAEVDSLLDLARAAAHDSGDRRNAPLVSYLVGLAHGRAGDVALSELARAAAGSET